ncbi:site-specific integrase [Piscinibacter sakaiensis]|uniref:site-specific integrase n=1 Tax=Piscinibacter sakaiensis TaxID=1547922 RepID=UPI003AAE9A37
MGNTTEFSAPGAPLATSVGGGAGVGSLPTFDEHSHGQSVAMLLAVIEGRSYEAVAADFGFARSTVERRVKRIAQRLASKISVSGEHRSLMSAKRIRREGIAVAQALQAFDPQQAEEDGPPQVIPEADMVRAALRIRHRSVCGRRDVAMFYILFATGARPLEVARLEVADYLQADGSVRKASTFRSEVTINGRPRPLYFASGKLTTAIDEYLCERASMGWGVGTGLEYRGLDPRSRLFLSNTGQPFEIVSYGQVGQRRFLCKAILETYRKIFRNSELQGASPLAVRRTLVDQLYDRRADDEQVALLLGMDRRTVRDLFPRRKPTIVELVEELI